MNKPHVHAALIKAWADGAQIEFWNEAICEWKEALTPTWRLNMKYRIKPREFEEGAWYPTVDKLGVREIQVYKFGQFGSSANSGTHPLGDFAWIGLKIEIEWPEESE